MEHGATGAVLHDFLPFGAGVLGGARVGLSYVTDDAHADMVVGNGPGNTGAVRVFDGVTGNQLPAPMGEYAPFGTDTVGVFVAASNDPSGQIYGDFTTYVGTSTGSLNLGDMLGDNGNTDPGQFTVSIDWGDGTNSDGWVVYTGDDGMGQQTFLIQGEHTYMVTDGEMSPFTVSVQVDDANGTQVAGTLNATVLMPEGQIPVVWIGSSDQIVAEGHSTQVAVYRSGDWSQPLTVNLGMGGDGQSDPLADWAVDYTITSGSGSLALGASGGTLTFAAGEDEVDLNVNAVADGINEPDEGFRITILTDGSSYQAGWDGTGDWTDSTADVLITANAAPIVDDDTETTHSDPIDGVLDGYDLNDDPITFALASGPSQGQVVVNSDGTFHYTPNAGAIGTDMFTVSASDGLDGSGMGTVTITFTNDSPIPDSELTAAWPGQAVSFGWTGTDFDDDLLSVTGWTSPQRVSGATLAGGYGTVSYNATTSQFTYTPPDATWTGTVAFNYTVGDGHGATTTAAATVNVLATGNAAGVNDNYQLLDDGTLTVAAAEGVLANDFVPDSQVAAVLANSLDPSIGTMTLNADGGFSIALTPAANADPTPVTINYNIISTQDGGGVIGTGIVTLPTVAADTVWFRASEVTFGGSFGGVTIKPITSDDGTQSYDSQQWLDKNADGMPDAQEPIRFVRNNAGSVRVPKVVMVPVNPVNLDPTKYKLIGEVVLDGTATGIILESGAGAFDGQTKNWKFTNLLLTATSNKFPSVAYYPEMKINWKIQRIGQAESMNAGDTVNPTYITWNALFGKGSTNNFKLLRTFVALGSDGAGGEDVTTPAQMIARAWSKFEQQESGLPFVQTWDGLALVYYDNWLYRGTGPFTESKHLVSVHDGDCTSFARLFIDALRAQGIENSDDFWVVKPVKPPGTTGLPVMFIGTWTANNGRQPPNNPAYAAYRWLNSSTAVSATGDRAGWDQVNGTWQYSWTTEANDVTKAGDQFFGQNNQTPLGIFANHVIVKIGTTFYDPSYGRTVTATANAARLRAWEDAAVGYYGLMSNLKLTPPRSVTYWIKPNPKAANTPADMVRDATVTDY